MGSFTRGRVVLAVHPLGEDGTGSSRRGRPDQEGQQRIGLSSPNMPQPLLPIPEPLRANEVGTFAEDSVVRRLPEIALRTAEENRLDGEHLELVEALAREINTATLSHIDEPEAPDRAAWRDYVEPHLGSTWLEVPWFFAETYFYRRLLSATGYSRPGKRGGVDPFAHQKRIALDGAMDLAARLGESLGDPAVLLAASLWSNRVDLSLWPAGESDSDARTAAVLDHTASHVLVDDSAPIMPPLHGGSVHMVLDNAGAELVADLALAASVLSIGGSVTLHAKPHPTFVSDAMAVDIEATIRRLADEDSPANRIAIALDDGNLTITTHPFWVSPLPFWERPKDLDRQLGAADLIVIKGDANYRRLLGDRHWEPTTPFAAIVLPPAPLVAVRAAKAEVIAGLDAATVAQTAATDPDWLVNGQWGLIQHAPANSAADR